MKKVYKLCVSLKAVEMSVLGRAMRSENNQLIQLLLQGKIEGERSQGRRRTSWINNITQ